MVSGDCRYILPGGVTTSDGRHHRLSGGATTSGGRRHILPGGVTTSDDCLPRFEWPCRGSPTAVLAALLQVPCTVVPCAVVLCTVVLCAVVPWFRVKNVIKM